jgi:HK97 family phage portal protein
MAILDKLKSFFDLGPYADKAFVQRELAKKGLPGFTNEVQSFSAPVFNIKPPDEYIGSVDYRGAIDSAINGAYSSRNFVELFHCLPEIFAPVHAIASRIANADFQLRKFRNDQVVYDNETWNRLFDTPNPLQHFRELIYEAVVYDLVTGNEMMYLNTPSTLTPSFENISTIWNLPADQIDIVAKEPLKLYTATSLEDIVNYYKLDDKNRFYPQDILHIRNTNIKWKDGKIRGKSPLLSADKAIANLIAVYEARNVIYTKRGALGFIVSRKSDGSGLISITPKEKQAIREEYNGNYGVTNNKTPLGITEAPIDFVKIGMSISELQPFEETFLDAQMIYAALNVPEDLMPKQKGATYENQLQAERRLYTGVIIPKATMYMQSLTNKLRLNEKKLYLYASFDSVDALQENKKEKALTEEIQGKVYLQRFKSGVCTINDWIIATGNEKDPNPICDKKIFELEDAEIAKLVGLFRVNNTPNNQNPNNNGQQNDGNQAGN